MGYEFSGRANGKTEPRLQSTPWTMVNERKVGTNLVDGPRGAVDEGRLPIFIGRDGGETS